MIRFSILLLCSFFSFLLVAQDTVNINDALGRKQGYWRKVDTAGKVIYEGRFKDGLPEGEFRYYYPDGKIKTISKVSGKMHRAQTISYFPNGKKMAAGNYLNEKKDSTWQFFSETNGTLVSEDTYRAGLIDGTSRVYYPDGVLSELIHVKNNVRNGLWEQYYLDGTLKLRGIYKSGEKEGEFKAFFINGKLMISGQYTEGHQHGMWVYYDEKGLVVKKETYNMGVLISVDPPVK